MSIEIKRSIKPVNYTDALKFLEDRATKINKNESEELIWILEHPPIFTAGTSFNENDILDKSINITKTSRGGKITWHGPGQLICYLAINLNNRKKDIRNFIKILENSIIKTLTEYDIQSYNDRKNIGIWVNTNGRSEKVAAIGIKVKKWIAYHGFSLNVDNDLSNYKKIIPCGILDKGVTTLKKINNRNYNRIAGKIIKNLHSNLEN